MSSVNGNKRRKMDDDGSENEREGEEQQQIEMEDVKKQEENDEDDANPSASPDASSSPADLAPLPAALLSTQLPAALSLLRELNGDLATCKRKELHDLRKEVLRLAAALQDSHFQGETRDAAAKRQYRRKEKGERAARELKQKSADQKYINSVALRNSRIQALNALMEAEATGEKMGDRLLAPGESQKLLLGASGDSSSADPSLVSLLASNDAFTPSAEVRAAAQGPQSFVYPTIAPGSELAKSVGAGTEEKEKEKEKENNNKGKKGQQISKKAAAAATSTDSSSSSSAAAPCIVVPSLPVDLSNAKNLSRTQAKKQGLLSVVVATSNGANDASTEKKAMFGQEGVHVNTTVLQQATEKEQEKVKEQDKQQATAMDTSSSSSSASAASSAAPAAAASSSSTSTSSPLPPSSLFGPPAGTPEFGPILNNPRSCYCCKSRFYQLHFFYSEFCASCARLNYAKRMQTADLRGKVILLTGSRVKIGFRCGLRILQCGATLIATSRFPHDTAKRYASEPDFNVWRDRLHIFGLDLRDLKSVVRLSEILTEKYDRLDAIINNAAQTVRRPPMYYRHLLPIETMKPEEMPKDWKEVVKGDMHEMSERIRIKEQGDAIQAKRLTESSSSSSSESKSGITVEDISHIVSEAATHAASATVTDAPLSPMHDYSSAAAASAAASSSSSLFPSSVADSGVGSVMDAFHRNDDINSALLTSSSSSTNRSAVLSQLAVLPGDLHADSALFPANRFDVTGQQLDLRSVNSWNLTLDQVDPSELVEVFAINALAPFILNSRLKALMLKTQHQCVAADKYIINVSAMEGKFYRHKSACHPHTNAAKAALNMMTRTSAQSYALNRIYMNAVDTGWINDENPYETAKRLHEQQNFQTPIDEEDAMARILDPMLSGVNTGINCFGKFFKDYHCTEW